MESQQNEAALDAQAAAGQSQFRLRHSSLRSQLHRDAAMNQNAGVLQQTSDSVKTMSHGAADIASGAASGVLGLVQGAAMGAANLAEGAAGAVKNTLGSNK